MVMPAAGLTLRCVIPWGSRTTYSQFGSRGVLKLASGAAEQHVQVSPWIFGYGRLGAMNYGPDRPQRPDNVTAPFKGGVILND